MDWTQAGGAASPHSLRLGFPGPSLQTGLRRAALSRPPPSHNRGTDWANTSQGFQRIFFFLDLES